MSHLVRVLYQVALILVCCNFLLTMISQIQATWVQANEVTAPGEKHCLFHRVWGKKWAFDLNNRITRRCCVCCLNYLNYHSISGCNLGKCSSPEFARCCYSELRSWRHAYTISFILPICFAEILAAYCLHMADCMYIKVNKCGSR